MEIRKLRPEDAPALLKLYRAATAEFTGLIRTPEEITSDYARKIPTYNTRNGLALGGVTAGGDLAAAIHAAAIPGIRALRHVLTDLTVAVHPERQGRGLGRALFTAFLEEVSGRRPDIYRVELYTHATNTRNRDFYASLGFREEGAQAGKIIDEHGRLYTPVFMAWFNPGFRQQLAKKE